MKLSLFRWFNFLFSSYCPRYPLKIEDKLYRNNELNYQIIGIGEQRPFMLSATEILSGKKIKEHLRPDDLISVVEDFLKERTNASQYRLEEINRDGTYLLRNKNHSFLITGSEFCKRADLIEQTHPMDSYRIISNLYFNIGRDVEKSITQGRIPSVPNSIIKIVK